MLQPKRTKFRKMHKGRNEGLSWSANAVSFGEYGLKSTAFGQRDRRDGQADRRAGARPDPAADQDREIHRQPFAA